MRLPIFPTRRIGHHTGLALVVASAFLLGAFVSDAAAHRSSGVRFRGGAVISHPRVVVRSGPRRIRVLHHGPRVRVVAPIRRYYRPRVFIGLGLGFGHAYYHRPRVVVRDRYIYRNDDVRDRRAPLADDFDVTNEPPPGCYYHDRFCDRDFSNLDDYTEHVLDERHSQTIDIIERRTGDRLRTLEFVNGEWGPQASD